MLDQFMDYFLMKPKRMISLGRFLFNIGCIVIVIALIAHIGTTATGIMGALGGAIGQEKSLAEMYPALPTWWIPESIIGAIPALALIAVGIWLNLSGKQVQRFMNG